MWNLVFAITYIRPLMPAYTIYRFFTAQVLPTFTNYLDVMYKWLLDTITFSCITAESRNYFGYDWRQGIYVGESYVNKTGNLCISVTSWHVRATIVAMKNNTYYIFWVCFCILFSTQSACTVLYSHLWSVGLYDIFPHYLTNVTIKRKECNVFLFSLQLWLKYFSF